MGGSGGVICLLGSVLSGDTGPSVHYNNWVMFPLEPYKGRRVCEWAFVVPLLQCIGVFVWCIGTLGV